MLHAASLCLRTYHGCPSSGFSPLPGRRHSQIFQESVSFRPLFKIIFSSEASSLHFALWSVTQFYLPHSTCAVWNDLICCLINPMDRKFHEGKASLPWAASALPSTWECPINTPRPNEWVGCVGWRKQCPSARGPLGRGLRSPTLLLTSLLLWWVNGWLWPRVALRPLPPRLSQRVESLRLRHRNLETWPKSSHELDVGDHPVQILHYTEAREPERWRDLPKVTQQVKTIDSGLEEQGLVTPTARCFSFFGLEVGVLQGGGQSTEGTLRHSRGEEL